MTIKAQTRLRCMAEHPIAQAGCELLEGHPGPHQHTQSGWQHLWENDVTWGQPAPGVRRPDDEGEES